MEKIVPLFEDYSAQMEKICRVQDRLEEYQPPFEFAETELDSETRVPPGETSVWIEYKGVPAEVVERLNGPDGQQYYKELEQHFEEWNKGDLYGMSILSTEDSLTYNVVLLT